MVLSQRTWMEYQHHRQAYHDCHTLYPHPIVCFVSSLLPTCFTCLTKIIGSDSDVPHQAETPGHKCDWGCVVRFTTYIIPRLSLLVKGFGGQFLLSAKTRLAGGGHAASSKSPHVQLRDPCALSTSI